MRGDERPCPVCGARAGELLHHRRFVLPEGHPLADGYTVVTCRECGAAYATPLPPQEAYDRFYRDASKYADAATGTGSGAQAWDDERLADTARQLAALMPGRDAHIVDVGCGAGGLLRQLRLLGYTKLTGIDPAPACVASVEQVEGVRGAVGSLFALPADLEPADLVVLSHVLEHVREAGRALDQLHRLVPCGGRVYAEVPDAGRYAEFIVAPFLDFNTEHINHFSVHTLERLFASRGWRVVASGTKCIRSSPTALYPCAWVLAEALEAPDETSAGAVDRAGSSSGSRDHVLRDALLRYVKASDNLLAHVAARCAREQLAGREVIVWGTGQTTAILLADTPLGAARVVAFTDSNPGYHGMHIAGAPVIPPGQLRDRPDLPVVIGSLLHAAEIAAAITALGLPNPVIRLDSRIP
ncbi:MAG: methyltransferase domain-containing protein [Gemmatimonadaceae bacterium]|nr:methyltransferase domain-containing protein [Gemmatimonadaceae bacterium]